MTARGRFGGRASAARRLGVRTTVAATATISTGIVAVAAARPGLPRAGRPNASKAAAAPAVKPGTVAAQVPLVLTALDRRDCLPAATACADLTRHMTWLQAKGKVASVRCGWRTSPSARR